MSCIAQLQNDRGKRKTMGKCVKRRRGSTSAAGGLKGAGTEKGRQKKRKDGKQRKYITLDGNGRKR
jgi:hypothetical protein